MYDNISDDNNTTFCYHYDHPSHKNFPILTTNPRRYHPFRPLLLLLLPSAVFFVQAPFHILYLSVTLLSHR